MSAEEVLRRLRRFLLLLAILLFSGSLVELWLVEHTQDFIQWLAFAIAGAGALATLIALIRPGLTSVRVLRACMLLVVLGSLFGVYEHIAGNIAFEREIQPGASTSRLLSRGLRGGNPLLAPGLLAVAAVLASSATYGYGLHESDSSEQPNNL